MILSLIIYILFLAGHGKPGFKRDRHIYVYFRICLRICFDIFFANIYCFFNLMIRIVPNEITYPLNLMENDWSVKIMVCTKDILK